MADAVTIAISRLMTAGGLHGVPLEIVMTAAALNAGLAAVVMTPIWLLRRRRQRPGPTVVSRWPI